LPELRKIQQAGGKLSEILIKELIGCRPQAEIFIMYGQTEATARLSCLEPSLLKEKMGSIGKGIPGVVLRVLNEQGDEVAPGETGEIVARGENISPGYLNNNDANAEKFVNGALKTGDLATVDQDGYITIVDRKSDFIKSLGNRVSSQQVEAYALELKDIVSAAVIGAPDLVRGEAIILFVTLRSGSQLSPDQIIRHFKSRTASYMVPKDVIIIKRMPTNANGKVMKSELKQMLPF
jgi:acyl-CoA synthetase (AMP-forming)/AMP-acid ligase II